MKLILTTETSITSEQLKNKIIKAVKGEMDNIIIDTWSYLRSGDNFDIVYHNPSQYIDTPENNVVFRLGIDGSEVYFENAWWKSNPEPSKDMFCLHIGRLTEMLLTYFSSEFFRFYIVDF